MKWKLEIEMKLLGENGIRIEIEFFQNENNTDVKSISAIHFVHLTEITR